MSDANRRCARCGHPHANAASFAGMTWLCPCGYTTRLYPREGRVSLDAFEDALKAQANSHRAKVQSMREAAEHKLLTTAVRALEYLQPSLTWRQTPQCVALDLPPVTPWGDQVLNVHATTDARFAWPEGVRLCHLLRDKGEGFVGDFDEALARSQT